MSETENAEWIKNVDLERRHLEGLLKDRMTLYVIFASLVLAGLPRIDQFAKTEALVLITVTVVLSLITGAIFRTYLLVEEALKDIKKDSSHPYTRYQKEVWFRVKATTLMLLIPFITSTCFAIATVVSIWRIY